MTMEFLTNYRSELLGTLICLAIILTIRLISMKAIHKIAKIRENSLVRTRMVIKYVTFALTLIAMVALVFIWGVDFQRLGILFSSVFAVIGVALFANWSILSNVTAGIILFIWFPFKIGDRIRMMDSDFSEEALILDIAAFHMHLRKDNGELLTYPNNLLLQKGVVLIEKNATIDDEIDYDI